MYQREVHMHPAGNTRGIRPPGTGPEAIIKYGRTFCSRVSPTGRFFLVTSDPEQVTCRSCLRKMSKVKGGSG